MNYKKYKYRILCEDKAHYHFVLGWLEHKGVNRRKVQLSATLPHSGSGKQYVSEHFSEELAYTLNLSSYGKEQCFLIVVLDADNKPVTEYYASLKNKTDDPVFLVIPKWSIDTWAHFLMSPDPQNTVDEAKPYKQQYLKGTPWLQMGKQLADMDLSALNNAPASLRTTYEHIKTKKTHLSM